MTVGVDTAHFAEHGWTRVEGAVPTELCARVVAALQRELKVPVDEPSRWHEYGGPMGDLIPMWGHQTQWDIRQHPELHRVFSTLWDTEALWVSLDSCRFTPPWQLGYAESYEIHWDHDPWDATKGFIQGVVSLTDTAADQGGFRCVPSLRHARETWPTKPTLDEDGDENWLPDISGHEIVRVPAKAGDVIVWDSRVPHGNSKNLAAHPRLAFYVSMFPTRDASVRDAFIESWRTGRCAPWWRNRPGYDRTEPWPPAQLTELGRRLLGIEPWPSRSAGAAPVTSAPGSSEFVLLDQRPARRPQHCHRKILKFSPRVRALGE